MLAKRTWQTAARIGAAAVLVGALSVAGCAGPGAPAKRAATPEASATASISASDAALLKALDSTGSPSPSLLSVARKRAWELWDELLAVPFSAETSVALPGDADSVSVKRPLAPRGRAKKRDRFEPDDTSGRASVMHRGSAQVHTISSPDDEDWIALPNDEGRGFYYIVASGEFMVRTKLRSGGKAVDARGSREGDYYYRCTPAGDHEGLGRYSWLNISAEKPISYRIMHLSSAPTWLIGEDEAILDSLVCSIANLDTTKYLIQTGRHATRAQLKQLQTVLFGHPVTGCNSGYSISPDDALLQRMNMLFEGDRTSVALWGLAERVGKTRVFTTAGRDGTWSTPKYMAKRELMRKLGEHESSQLKGAKPAIYLYPSREQSVTVRLDYRGVLTSTAPLIDSAISGWTVTAKPDGTLTDAVGMHWPYLFWEGLGLPRFNLSTGSVIRGSEADAFLRTALAERGLNASENREFREYWVPLLSANPWVLIRFEGAEYERHAQLTVSPKPDVSLRVFMVAKPLNAPMTVRPQRLAPPPKRQGFTLVEWGGTLLP